MFEVRGRAITYGYLFLTSAELLVPFLEVCAELW